jgi:N-sulfoglucosamine sulfohydrolase
VNKHRSFAYFMHNNIPEGPPYPIRAITDGTYHYIRNLRSENIYIEKHLMAQMLWHKYWPSWVFESADNEKTNYLVNRYMVRPKEELYNSVNDPNNMFNLIDKKELSQVKQKLSHALDLWMGQQNDPGMELDNWEYLNSSREGKHQH